VGPGVGWFAWPAAVGLPDVGVPSKRDPTFGLEVLSTPVVGDVTAGVQIVEPSAMKVLLMKTAFLFVILANAVRKSA
jgi:hypothetical protein